MTENDEMCFRLMDKCHICDKEYTDKNVRVRDHCYVTGNSGPQLTKNVT